MVRQRGRDDGGGFVGADKGARDEVDEPRLSFEGVWIEDGIAQ